MKQQSFTRTIAGRTYTAIYNDLAPQATQSVILSCDGTVILATAVLGKGADKNPGYFNLTVEYQEKYYAAGKIVGVQYQRREGRPSQSAVLGSRIIDRTIRPLFDQRTLEPVQIIATVLSLGDMDPVVLATNAVSLVLHTSSIPWRGPIGCVRVGGRRGEGSTLINPYFKNELVDQNASVDVLVCGTGTHVTMIESGCDEISETDMDSALDAGIEVCAEFVSWQNEIAAKLQVQKKEISFSEISETIKSVFHTEMDSYIQSELFGSDSKTRIGNIEKKWNETYTEYVEKNPETDPKQKSLASEYLHHVIDEVLHKAAIDKKTRADGRSPDQIRELYAQAGGLSDRLHGTGIFYRGETHVLSVTTLAGPDSNLLHEGMETSGEQRFFHHYNFPPFSVGEAGRIGFTNRREIGHGALVEKAIAPVIPKMQDFPYTIRVVSECVSSNGSTSQASICASTLALMDAGIPIVRPVVGISMGLMLDVTDENRYTILTDIQGPEDHHGDMDFKLAGTVQGITAIQMDIKLDGVPVKIIKETIRQARKAHSELLEVITKEIPTHRPELSPYAPRIEILMIDPEKIGMVIGSGGKTIQKMQRETETDISIEDSGQVVITGGPAGVAIARTQIEAMTKEWKPGEKATGTVVKILDDTGAIVELAPGVTGMIHISEISKERIDTVSSKLAAGQSVEVVVVSVDPERGRIGLSIKRLNDTSFEVGERNSQEREGRIRADGSRDPAPRPHRGLRRG
jgi:polyribonucleotide nucleotidyltransferase